MIPNHLLIFVAPACMRLRKNPMTSCQVEKIRGFVSE